MYSFCILLLVLTPVSCMAICFLTTLNLFVFATQSIVLLSVQRPGRLFTNFLELIDIYLMKSIKYAVYKVVCSSGVSKLNVCVKFHSLSVTDFFFLICRGIIGTVVQRNQRFYILSSIFGVMLYVT
jgi:hypothetical protein